MDCAPGARDSTKDIGNFAVGRLNVSAPRASFFQGSAAAVRPSAVAGWSWPCRSCAQTLRQRVRGWLRRSDRWCSDPGDKCDASAWSGQTGQQASFGLSVPNAPGGVGGFRRRRSHRRSTRCATSSGSLSSMPASTWRAKVKFDTRNLRSTEAPLIVGQSKAPRPVGWAPGVMTPEVGHIMVDSDLAGLASVRVR